ncbi:MAG: hypothetical protein QNJ64_03215 [Crocosphaera sp.]|nr:hypothetical protein [Crocosphaera sp.]
MTINDRKKRILEHLKQSTDGTQYISVKQTSKTTTSPIAAPETLESPETTPENLESPETTPETEPVSQPVIKDDRKQKIMSHVNSSSSNFGNFSLKDENKKTKIEEHIRKSLS